MVSSNSWNKSIKLVEVWTLDWFSLKNTIKCRKMTSYWRHRGLKTTFKAKLVIFCLILRIDNTKFTFSFLKLMFVLILISLVKPFHAFIIIFPLSLFLIKIFILEKKYNFLFVVFILFISLVFKIFPFISNFHNYNFF